MADILAPCRQVPGTRARCFSPARNVSSGRYAVLRGFRFRPRHLLNHGCRFQGTRCSATSVSHKIRFSATPFSFALPETFFSAPGGSAVPRRRFFPSAGIFMHVPAEVFFPATRPLRSLQFSRLRFRQATAAMRQPRRPTACGSPSAARRTPSRPSVRRAGRSA